MFRARLLDTQGNGASEMKAFVYQGPDQPGSGNGISLDGASGAVQLLWNKESAPEPVTSSPQAEEDVQAREQQAWQNGFQEASEQAREQLAQSLAAERAALAGALAEFARRREAYFQQAEGEVVRLVLSIARKVLHRESQVDPMLLTGVVRVALEKIAAGTAVKLRVPSTQADAWNRAIQSFQPPHLAIEVVPDKSLAVPSCIIVTEMGSTDISVDAQLSEIERGFLDLLAQRREEAAH